MSGRRIASTRAVLAMLLSSVVVTANAARPGPVAFRVTTADGRVVDAADFRGRWLLVNWWATWCGACVAEMPRLSRFAEGDRRIAVLGLTDETLAADALRAFLVAHPVSYLLAVVERETLPPQIPAKAFGLAMRPISDLVAPDGEVVERYVGDVDVRQVVRDIEARPR